MNTRFLSGLLLTATGAFAGWAATGPWMDGPQKNARRSLLLPPATDSRGIRPQSVPEAALLRTVFRAGHPGEEMREVLRLANGIAPEDIVRLLQAERFLPAGVSRDVFKCILLARWLDSDPAAAVRWCGAHYPEHVPQLAADWARRDPAAAQAWARTKSSAFAAVAEVLAERDPAGALAFLSRAGPAASDYNLLASFDTLARHDLQWLLREAENLPPVLMAQARNAAARALAKQDFTGALAWAGAQKDRQGLLPEIFSSGAASPAALLTAWTGLTKTQRDSVGWTSNTWSRSDPGGFVDALYATPGIDPADPSLRGAVASAIVGLMPKDSAAAPAFLAERFPGHPELWTPFVARRWADTDPAAATAWANSLEDEKLRTEALDIIAQQSAPPAAMTKVEEQLWNFGAHSLRAMDGLGDLTSSERRDLIDAERARGSSTGTPAYDSAESAIRQNFPDEYSQWLADQPVPHSDRHAAFASEWAAADPRAAAAWAAALSAGEARGNALRSVAQSWDQYAPDEVRTWANTLPEADREAVIKQLETER